MNIQLEFEASDSTNVLFSVSIDGKNCGKLSMPSEKAAGFVKILQRGAENDSNEFNMSGEIPTSQHWVLWHKRSGIERREMEDRRSGKERRTITTRRGGDDKRKLD